MTLSPAVAVAHSHAPVASPCAAKGMGGGEVLTQHLMLVMFMLPDACPPGGNARHGQGRRVVPERRVNHPDARRSSPASTFEER